MTNQHKHPKTIVIIPALNEAGSIFHVVNNIHQNLPSVDVVVVNDGSTDRTTAQARLAGAVVLTLPYNVGIGAAVQTGFMFADQLDYEIAIRSDGDGQHNPQEMKKLIEQLQSSECDMIIGTRYSQGQGYQSTLARRAGSLVLSTLLSLIMRQKITDPTSGYAVFNRRAIKLWAKCYPHDYPEPEALVISHRAGLRVGEVPVQMKPRYAGNSSISGLRPVYYMIKVILAVLMGLVRPAQLIDMER